METCLLSKECRNASVIQMFEIINDRGLGLDNKLLRSYHLMRSKKCRRFPPRTEGLWFVKGIMDDFREAAIVAENAEGIKRLTVRFTEGLRIERKTLSCSFFVM